MSPALGRIASPLAIIAVAAGMLEAAGRAGFLPMTIPAPSDIATALNEDFFLLAEHVSVTLQAAAVGFVGALSVCLLLMLIVARYRRAESVVYNAALLLHTMPLLVIAPILVVWFGLGLESRIVISALASYYAILIGGLHGLRATPARTEELMHLLSASRTQIFRMVTLPYALPALFAGIKVGATGAVLGAVIAEWTGAESGLGVMMSYSLFSFQVSRVWLTMFTMMGLAVTVFSTVQFVERRVLRWTAPGAALS